jgi:prolyl 4-hydroxylase
VVRVAARAARPLLAVFNDVLAPDECAQLIELARPRLKPSTIVDPMTGRDVVAGTRASLGMFFRLQETPFIARLDKRLSELMNLPLENGEGLQILHYPQGAGSEPHFDFLVPSNPANAASIARSGQRASTLVAYLNDVPAGGQTMFPEAGWAVSPQCGNAVYFEYCNSRGQVDHASLHASAPVEQGEKWVATKWMRQRRFVSA